MQAIAPNESAATPATLKDVADAVGVNPSTVSRALHGAGGGRVSEARCREIRDVAQRLGYRANASAQSLARRSSQCIGVIVPELQDPVFMQYVAKLDVLLQAHGLQAIPLASDPHGQGDTRCLQTLATGQVDAVISLHCPQDSVVLIQDYCTRGHHVIVRCVDRPIDELPFDCVGVDVADAFVVLAQHLYDVGCRKIGFVGGLAVDEAKTGERQQGGARYLAKAHEALGLEMETSCLLACSDAAGARDVVMEVFDQARDRFDALIVQSSKILPGVRRALKELNLTIPDDCAVACISDADVCRFMDVPVTVWDQPVEKICRGLVKLLLGRLRGETTVHQVQYASRLIVRESTSRCEKETA